ncbi:MAG: MBOAT family protein, partial [Acetobacteraceae bacterium]|nr:MBOAT family protein [Acetobacteraceae bacterium]
MLFNSAVFLFGFLPVCSGVFLLLRRRLPWLLVPWLLACSFVFYGWWSPRFLVLLLVSTLVNWGIARALVRARPEGRQLLVAGLAWNLGLLGWFKYTNFLIATADAITGFAIAPLDIVLPLGISFFTFQKIAYLVDVHDGRAEPGGLLDFMIFVFFFPQLIAGPIVHHSEMLPQFRGLSAHEPPGREQAGPNLVLGGVVLLAGLFSKVVVADQLAPYANAVFDAARDGAAVGCLEAWQAALAYTGQLYFDFSGYSIMALGLGLLFGIRLPLNFNSPYQASSIIEFWRRWHITLSRFLKDYLYVPLGGNRKGPLRRHVNLMVVMVLGGLWHGAGWTFVIWGALHGVALVLAHLWRARMGDRMPALAGWLLTMLVVVVGWVFFR